MIKLVNIQQLEGRLIKVDVLIEGKINNTFEVVLMIVGMSYRLLQTTNKSIIKHKLELPFVNM